MAIVLLIKPAVTALTSVAAPYMALCSWTPVQPVLLLPLTSAKESEAKRHYSTWNHVTSTLAVLGFEPQHLASELGFSVHKYTLNKFMNH